MERASRGFLEDDPNAIPQIMKPFLPHPAVVRSGNCRSLIAAEVILTICIVTGDKLRDPTVFTYQGREIKTVATTHVDLRDPPARSKDR